MVYLIGQKSMNRVVSHLEETKHAVDKEADKVERHAKANLSEARASTRWHKIFGPDHLTQITRSHGDIDEFVNLEAPNAMAIEFGHAPSGVFAGTDTKSPDGLYILIRAAIAGEVS